MNTLECTLQIHDPDPLHILLWNGERTTETGQLFDHTACDTIRTWFENPSFSDLTLELEDGRSMPVHRMVLCSRNLYFYNLIGSGGSAANMGIETIKFPTADARAVRAVICHIYGWTLERQEPVGNSDWVYWLSLIIAAAAMFEPQLADAAQGWLRDYLVELCAARRHDEATAILEEMHDSIARPRVMWIIVHAALLMEPYIVPLQNDRLCEFIMEHEEVLEAVLEVLEEQPEQDH